jgi:class 3 adenylate cyclase
MPLYMDIHHGVNAGIDELSTAHLSDLEVQEKHGVQYLRWWFNPSLHTVYCLVDAPNADAATKVHVEAHGDGGKADKIVEVASEIVEAFLGESVDAGLGRMVDPAGNPDGGFRTILFTDLEASTVMTQRLGDAEATRLLRVHDQILRREIQSQGGRVIKHTGDGLMAAFPSASSAVRAAIAIQQSLRSHNLRITDRPLRVRIGISAGEPVDDGEDLFGATVQLARRVCDAAPAERIWVANVVRELCIGKEFEFAPVGTIPLRGFAELAALHEVVWTKR